MAFDWKIDLAIILASASILYNIIKTITDWRRNRKNERIKAYEQVFEESCYILEYPFHKKTKEAKGLQYTNEDKELERAVRRYLDAHVMGRMFGHGKFVPKRIMEQGGTHDYMQRVFEEAKKFEDEVFKHQIDMTPADMSPAQYMDEEEISDRFNHIMKYIGKHLSLFSEPIRRAWDNAKMLGPAEIRDEYRRSLDVCPNYFEHNPRDFDDPFLEIPSFIRAEYRAMNETLGGRLKFKLSMMRSRLPMPLSHPILSFKTRKRFRRRPRYRFKE